MTDFNLDNVFDQFSDAQRAWFNDYVGLTQAATPAELQVLVAEAAFKRHCELNDDTYTHQSQFLLSEAAKQFPGWEDMVYLAALLRAADIILKEMNDD